MLVFCRERYPQPDSRWEDHFGLPVASHDPGEARVKCLWLRGVCKNHCLRSWDDYRKVSAVLGREDREKEREEREPERKKERERTKVRESKREKKKHVKKEEEEREGESVGEGGEKGERKRKGETERASEGGSQGEGDSCITP